MRKNIFSVLMTLALVLIIIPVSTATAFASTEQRETEPNDYVQYANEINIDSGNSVCGTLKEYRDVDYYKFTLNKSSVVTVDAFLGWEKPGELQNGYVDAFLYDYNDLEHSISELSTEYNNSYGFSKGQEVWYLPKGTYILSVTVSLVEDGEPYKLSFQTEEHGAANEPNDYIGQATPLNLNEIYHEMLHYYYYYYKTSGGSNRVESFDKDIYKLATTKNENFYLNISDITGKDEFRGLEIHLLDAEGNKLELWEDKDYLYVKDGETITSLVSLPAGINYLSFEAERGGLYEFSVIKQLEATTNIATFLYGHNDISVNWTPVADAEGYHVYYKKTEEDAFVHWGDTTTTSIQMEDCVDGTGYCFKVVAYKTVNGVVYDGAETSSDYIYSLKQLEKATVTKANGASVKVFWSDISGESGYEIAKSKSKDKGYTVVKTVSSDVENAVVKTTWNKPFYYKVRAFKIENGEKIYGPWSSSVKYTRYLSAPTKVNATLSGEKAAKISWSKVAGASGYNVYYKKASAKKYTFLKRTTGKSIKKTGLASNVKYKFKVVPYYKSGSKRIETAESKTASVYILAKVQQPKVSKKSQNYVTVSWKNISGESGYQIARSTSATKNFKVVKSVGSSYKKVKISAKRKQTYYYKVRAYKYVDGKKVFGAWSKAKAFKLK